MRIRASNSRSYPPLSKTVQILLSQHFLPDTCIFSWVKADNLLEETERSLRSPATPSSYVTRSPGHAHHTSSWRGCIACACGTWSSAPRIFPCSACLICQGQQAEIFCKSLQHLIMFELYSSPAWISMPPFYLFLLWPTRSFCLDPLIPLIFIVSDHMSVSDWVCVILQV